MSIGIVSDFREVVIFDYWDIYYQPTESLPNIAPPVFNHNYHQAQYTVLSVGIGSDLVEVSIADFSDISYPQNNWPIFHPLFLRRIIIR